MANSNVIDFVLALQRQRERQNNRAAYAGDHGPWRTRYDEGIDGLLATRRAWPSPAEIVPFVTARTHLPVKVD